jgi:hypothetical protein
VELGVFPGQACYIRESPYSDANRFHVDTEPSRQFWTATGTDRITSCLPISANTRATASLSALNACWT